MAIEKFDDPLPGDDPVTTEEQKHVARLQKRIKAFEKPLKERAKGWKRARNYADGDVYGADANEDSVILAEDSRDVTVNLIGSMLETIQPAIYAKAPEISVEVNDQISSDQYPLIGPFAKTLEKALNEFLVKDAKLKKRGKVAVRGSLTSTIAYVKLIYQREKKDDPVIRNRINDTQDNLQQIEVLLKETSEQGGLCDDYEAKMFELKQELAALEAKVEVTVSEGLVLDNLSAEDLIIMDAAVKDVDEFVQATEIAHKIKMTVGAFKQQFGKAPPQGFKKYTENITGEDAVDADLKDLEGDDVLLTIHEVWSLKDNTIYTTLEGVREYIRPPYQPTTLGEQWYGFFGLQFRRVDGKKYPKSMVEQLIQLQDEYNKRRTNAAAHRQKNIPVRIVNKSSGITDDEIGKINARSIDTDVIGVTAELGENFAQQLASFPEIPYNEQMYDTSDILFDMEKVGNTQDAASGAIRTAKTATEAEIAAAGQQGRTGESLDVIEDWLTDIATYAAQLLLQNVPEAVIKQKFGPDAVWPQLTKKEMFSMVNIGIRAGSTSKPNKMRERDQWIQILPEIQKGLEVYTNAITTGNATLANVTINLLDETLKRFDEKLDAKTLLGINDAAQGTLDPALQGQVPGLPPTTQPPVSQPQVADLAAMLQQPQTVQ